MLLHPVCLANCPNENPVVGAFPFENLNHRPSKVLEFHAAFPLELPSSVAHAVMNPAHRLLLRVPRGLDLCAIHHLFRVVR